VRGNGQFTPDRAVGAADRALAADLAYDRRGRGQRLVGKVQVAEVPRVYFCPECQIEFKKPEALGSHLERHRPVGPPVFCKRAGKENVQESIECPKGCGGHFINEEGGWEWRKGMLKEHTQN